VKDVIGEVFGWKFEAAAGVLQTICPPRLRRVVLTCPGSVIPPAEDRIRLAALRRLRNGRWEAYDISSRLLAVA